MALSINGLVSKTILVLLSWFTSKRCQQITSHFHYNNDITTKSIHRLGDVDLNWEQKGACLGNYLDGKLT